MYAQIFLGQNIIIPNSCWKTYSLTKAGEIYWCLQSRNFDASIRDLNKSGLTPRPGEGESLLQQTVYKDNQTLHLC